MADPYYSRYSTLPDAGSNFPGYLSSSEQFPSSTLASHHIPASTIPPSDFLRKEVNALRPGSYGLDEVVNLDTIIGGDPKLLGQRRDATVDVIDRPSTSLANGDGASGTSVSRGDSNVLFVDGLPRDCTRREVGHIFRPFVGYKDIKVIHKEPRRSGDRAMVLCFVEFVDAKCARTAKEALQALTMKTLNQ